MDPVADRCTAPAGADACPGCPACRFFDEQRALMERILAWPEAA